MSITVDKKSVITAIRDARFPKGYPVDEIARQLELDTIAYLKTIGAKDGIYTVCAGNLRYNIVADNEGNPIIHAVKPPKHKRKP